MWLSIEQGQFAEEISRSQGRNAPIFPPDDCGATHDDEKVAPHLTLLNKQLTGGDFSFVECACDLLQLG